MMNILLEYDQEEKDEEDQNFSPNKLRFDRDCLEALKKSCQGAPGFI
jgi:hypothetical protein